MKCTRASRIGTATTAIPQTVICLPILIGLGAAAVADASPVVTPVKGDGDIFDSRSVTLGVPSVSGGHVAFRADVLVVDGARTFNRPTVFTDHPNVAAFNGGSFGSTASAQWLFDPGNVGIFQIPTNV